MPSACLKQDDLKRLNSSDVIGILCNRKQSRVSTLVSGEINEEERTVVFSASSEEPVERWFGNEVLEHSKSSIDKRWLDDGALLFNHRDHIGTIVSHEIRDGRLYVKVKFSRNQLGEEKLRDVVDGILRKASIGYRINELKLDESTNGGPDTYRVKRWTLFEVSLVPVPADPTVGVGRSMDLETTEIVNKLLADKAASERNKEESKSMGEQAQTQVTVRDHSLDEIITLGRQFKAEDLALDAIARGLNKQEFAKELMAKKSATETVRSSTKEDLGLTKNEARRFSFRKAIMAQHLMDWSGSEFEREVCDAARKKFNKQDSRNLIIPVEILRAADDGSGVSFSTGDGANASALVAQSFRDRDFIEILREKMTVRSLGARVLSGLTGEVHIPRQSGSATAEFVNENEDVGRTLLEFSQVTLAPKTVAAHTGFTTKLLAQNSLDVEMLIREDLAAVIAAKIDQVAINGSGKGAEPLGIMQATAGNDGVLSTAAGTDMWKAVVELETMVANKSADLGRLAYLTSPTMRGVLKTTVKTGTQQFIWSSDNTVNGYSAHVTTHITKESAGSVIFANWADLIVSDWGALELVVDPYTLAHGNKVRVVARQEVDVQRRHNESFAVLTGGGGE